MLHILHKYIIVNRIAYDIKIKWQSDKNYFGKSSNMVNKLPNHLKCQ